MTTDSGYREHAFDEIRWGTRRDDDPVMTGEDFVAAWSPLHAGRDVVHLECGQRDYEASGYVELDADRLDWLINRLETVRAELRESQCLPPHE